MLDLNLIPGNTPTCLPILLNMYGRFLFILKSNQRNNLGFFHVIALVVVIIIIIIIIIIMS